MNLKEIRSLQVELLERAESKGHNRSGRTNLIRGESMMFIIGKLGEAAKGFKQGKILGNGYDGPIHHIVDTINLSGSSKGWIDNYERLVKDTVGEKLASAYLRFINWCNYHEEVIYNHEYSKESTGNFSYDLLRVVHYAMECFHHVSGKTPGYFIISLEQICLWWHIDLDWYVRSKMRYDRMLDTQHKKQ